MTPGDLVPPHDDDRLLLAERDDWAEARISHAPGALLLVRPGASGDVLLARGDAAGVTDLLDAEARLRYRTGAEPALWLSVPRDVVVPAWVLDTLRLTPFSTWDWMWTETAPPVPPVVGGARLAELDRSRDTEAVHEVLRLANPRSTADPLADREVAWWGAWDGDALVGVVGARLEQGRTDGVSWHLHGLAVLEGARGRGLGGALTAALTRAGLARGADWVSLGLYADNDGARRIYRRLGFSLGAAMASAGPVTATRPLK